LRILILIEAIVAVVVLTAGLIIAHSISSRAVTAPTLATVLSPTPPPTISQTVVPRSRTPTSPPPTLTPRPFFERAFTYGHSFDGRPLLAYRFGTGPSARAIIGGIHGGYEWNTVVLVNKMLEYLQDHPTLVPDEVTLYVIPCANPDGYAAGTDRECGRTNGNSVDLNRNWEYQWQPTATHGYDPVEAGAHAFSEPETAALRDLILEQDVEAAIFYHSALAQIFYGAQRDRSATYELALTVSEATGYPIAAGVPGQITTGNAIDWMSAQGIAGIEVELTTHEDIEWERNLKGLLVFLSWKPPASRQGDHPALSVGARLGARDGIGYNLWQTRS
jgi:hypothetical protein